MGIAGLLLKPPVLVALALALMGGFGAIQTSRLNNAKKDQIDPATNASWQSEEKRDGAALTIANRNLGTCLGNQQALQGVLDHQSAAVQAGAAQSARDTAAATRAAQLASVASVSAEKLAAAIRAPRSDHSCDATNALATSLP